MGEVVCNQGALCVERRGRNEKIGIRQEFASSIKFPIEGSRTFHDLIGKGEPVA